MSAEDIVKGNGGEDFKWATDPEERNRLWKARHEILYACTALCPGSKVNLVFIFFICWDWIVVFKVLLKLWAFFINNSYNNKDDDSSFWNNHFPHILLFSNINKYPRLWDSVAIMPGCRSCAALVVYIYAVYSKYVFSYNKMINQSDCSQVIWI